jgi:acyl-CoA reductase-like NAD-dependent aldehyde dehydrogenase
MTDWEETEDYHKWRKENPEAAKHYDATKQKKLDEQQKAITNIREYKKKQYASMTPDERRELLKQLKKVYEKRKK